MVVSLMTLIVPAPPITPRSAAKKIRVNELDLFRFVAAVAVVFYHCAFRGYAAHMSPVAYPHLAPVAKYGFLGVQLFFLISGFVILMTANSGGLQRFAVSRFVRLYPAFWVCCTITFLLCAAIGPPRWVVSVRQYVVNMTMLSGFLDVPSIDGVYWSLFVELRFYALIAVVLLIRQIERAQVFLLLWLAASVVLEFLPVRTLHTFLITGYSSYFIAGAACFLILSRGFSWVRLGMVMASWVFALLQAMRGLHTIEVTNGTTLNRYVVCGIITACFALMLAVSLRRTGWFGRRRWLMVGALTYPLYLLHQNLAYMAFNFGYPAIPPSLLLWITIAGLLALSWAVHVLVENRCAPVLKRALNRAIDSTRHTMEGLGARR
jgi:peptidoglycan/LPS O-acetylase OafA/YrhL